MLNLSLCQNESLSDLLKGFWEQEEILVPTTRSFEDQECERLFVEGCRRTNVRLPVRPGFKTNVIVAFNRAKQMLNSIHKKFKSDFTLETEYSQFMSEYEAKGHMRLLNFPNFNDNDDGIYYISHDAVWRLVEGLKKVRIVFNGSDKSFFSKSPSVQTSK